MKRLILAAALGLAGIVTPAAAQTDHAQLEAEASAPFLALKDALIANVGTSDTVILLYGRWVIKGTEAQFQFFVRYRVPGTDIVRVQGARLGPNIPVILDASHKLIDLDNDARSVSMVIDHGKAIVTIRHADVFEASTTWEHGSNAEIERVFPGLTIEPYKAPAD